MNTPSFMIVPSLSCQASCKYCFGPHEGAMMDEDTARAAVAFVERIAEETAAEHVSIVFHGGEPLLASMGTWTALLDEIERRLGRYRPSLSVQSNLWRLDDAFIMLFQAHGVRLGTSLDGPKKQTDVNRGEGYYERTMSAVGRARAAGMPVSGIATLSAATAKDALEVAKFYRDQGMSLVLHGAVAGLNDADSPYALSPDAYADALIALYPWYVRHRKAMKIDTLDHYARGLVHGQPGVCTFRDCLGMFLSIAPGGDITSCQRLAGNPEYAMGNVRDLPTLEQLYSSPVAQRWKAREAAVRERCGDCAYMEICKGGCYYGALASGDGVVDPQCEGYKKVYQFVQDRLMEELQSDENLEAMARSPARQGEHPLLREGPYISLAQDLHPARIADNARRILAISALGRFGSDSEAAQWLHDQRICGDVGTTRQLLSAMRRGMASERAKLSNCYLHVTLNCNLRCAHCYAEAGDGQEEMDPAAFEGMLEQGIQARFHKLVITGGEPLVHGRRCELLALCEKYRGRGSLLSLRTNLTGELPDALLTAIGGAFDQVVVSVDGDERSHDQRRGEGSYLSMTENLRRYLRLCRGVRGAAKVSLAAVLPAADIIGAAGQSVRELADRLGIERVNFRPMLPIGRAAQRDEPLMCEGLMAHLSPREMLDMESRPLPSCGIGQNLFIKPDGSAYPCYAWCGAHSYIGNARALGIGPLMRTPAFERLLACTVDTIEQCKHCPHRYLCGGACRAWGNQDALDPNRAPPHCDHLKRRAEALIREARAYLVEEG